MSIGDMNEKYNRPFNHEAPKDLGSGSTGSESGKDKLLSEYEQLKKKMDLPGEEGDAAKKRLVEIAKKANLMKLTVDTELDLVLGRKSSEVQKNPAGRRDAIEAASDKVAKRINDPLVAEYWKDEIDKFAQREFAEGMLKIVNRERQTVDTEGQKNLYAGIYKENLPLSSNGEVVGYTGPEPKPENGIRTNVVEVVKSVFNNPDKLAGVLSVVLALQSAANVLDEREEADEAKAELKAVKSEKPKDSEKIEDMSFEKIDKEIEKQTNMILAKRIKMVDVNDRRVKPPPEQQRLIDLMKEKSIRRDEVIDDLEIDILKADVLEKQLNTLLMDKQTTRTNFDEVLPQWAGKMETEMQGTAAYNTPRYRGLVHSYLIDEVDNIKLDIFQNDKELRRDNKVGEDLIRGKRRELDMRRDGLVNILAPVSLLRMGEDEYGREVKDKNKGIDSKGNLISEGDVVDLEPDEEDLDPQEIDIRNKIKIQERRTRLRRMVENGFKADDIRNLESGYNIEELKTWMQQQIGFYESSADDNEQSEMRSYILAALYYVKRYREGKTAEGKTAYELLYQMWNDRQLFYRDFVEFSNASMGDFGGSAESLAKRMKKDFSSTPEGVERFKRMWKDSFWTMVSIEDPNVKIKTSGSKDEHWLLRDYLNSKSEEHPLDVDAEIIKKLVGVAKEKAKKEGYGDVHIDENQVKFGIKWWRMMGRQAMLDGRVGKEPGEFSGIRRGGDEDKGLAKLMRFNLWTKNYDIGGNRFLQSHVDTEYRDFISSLPREVLADLGLKRNKDFVVMSLAGGDMDKLYNFDPGKYKEGNDGFWKWIGSAKHAEDTAKLLTEWLLKPEVDTFRKLRSGGYRHLTTGAWSDLGKAHKAGETLIGYEKDRRGKVVPVHFDKDDIYLKLRQQLKFREFARLTLNTHQYPNEESKYRAAMELLWNDSGDKEHKKMERRMMEDIGASRLLSEASKGAKTGKNVIGSTLDGFKWVVKAIQDALK